MTSENVEANTSSISTSHGILGKVFSRIDNSMCNDQPPSYEEAIPNAEHSMSTVESAAVTIPNAGSSVTPTDGEILQNGSSKNDVVILVEERNR